MKKSLGKKAFIHPMPVQMIATYNEDGSVDVMNAAWGGIIDYDLLILSLDESHKTCDNLKKCPDFTLSLANEQTLAESDFFGIVSYKKDKDKFNKTGFTFTHAEKINAPIVNEYPLTLLCHAERIDTNGGFFVYARIIDTIVDEQYVNEKGTVDVESMKLVSFSQIDNHYYAASKKVGRAWNIGTKYIKK